ncbi:MAG: hypothetical protein OXN89_07990 [Bryobacterales bacterium]|nr:hypothetical protein [Bryobacterales bacterium]
MTLPIALPPVRTYPSGRGQYWRSEVGYAHVSTVDQNPEAQIRVLERPDRSYPRRARRRSTIRRNRKPTDPPIAD